MDDEMHEQMQDRVRERMEEQMKDAAANPMRAKEMTTKEIDESLKEERKLARYLVEEEALEIARDYLSGYRVCADMLCLRTYERNKRHSSENLYRTEEFLPGNEAFWKARMNEIEYLISSIPNGREKLLLHYHYIQNESIERAADLLLISRRTAYRIHRHALLMVAALLHSRNRNAM